LRKTQQEVAEFRRLQELNEELTMLNQKICALLSVAPSEVGWTAQEKKRLLQSTRRFRGKSLRG
jgi:hypothetical protein